MIVAVFPHVNISGVECGVFEKPSRISIAFSDYFVVYSKKFSM
jgi:hypothetical protein